MDLDHLRELLKLVAASDVSEVEIEEDDLKIVIRKQSSTAAAPPQPQTIAYTMPPAGYPGPMPSPGAPPAAGAPPAPPAAQPGPNPASQPAGESAAQPAQVDESEGHEVRAPIVGTYYSAPEPEAEPFVSVGDHVSKGDVLCIIEAMKLMNEIEAEESGTIRRILVENATPVEYDQPLFVVEPD